MNQLSASIFQGSQRNFIRLFVQAGQKKFIATVDASKQNLSEQITNSYTCTFNQFQQETFSKEYQVINIRQNGFRVVIPKQLNIGQVLNDQSYLTCDIHKSKNKNKRSDSIQKNEKNSKKNLKEQQKINFKNSAVSPPKILTLNKIDKLVKIQQRLENQKKKNYLAQNQTSKNIEGQQKKQILKNFIIDKLERSQLQNDSMQNLKSLAKSIQNISQVEIKEKYQSDAFLADENIKNQQAQKKSNTELKKQDNLDYSIQFDKREEMIKNYQYLTLESKLEEYEEDYQKKHLQTNKSNNENNQFLKEGLDYMEEYLNFSQEIPKVPNSSFQTNIEHTIRQKNKESNKRYYNQQNQNHQNRVEKQQRQRKQKIKQQQCNNQSQKKNNQKQNQNQNQSILQTKKTQHIQQKSKTKGHLE